jgi:hypothetical protein
VEIVDKGSNSNIKNTNPYNRLVEYHGLSFSQYQGGNYRRAVTQMKARRLNDMENVFRKMKGN